MAAAVKPTTSIKERPVEFCPVCGVRSTPAEASEIEPRSASAKCSSCGFDLTLAAAQAHPVPATVPARVPGFAYLMLAIQCAASLVLAWAFVYLGSPLYLTMQQFLSILAVVSVVVIVGFGLWLRTGRAISWVRGALFALGLVTVPLGVCAMAAAVSIAGARRYCAICLRRIAWSEHYSSCPHCDTSFHRYGECRQARRQLIAQAWGREPSGEELNQMCPFCFQSLRRDLTGGSQR